MKNTFEDNILRLEEIVEKLSNGDLPLQKSLELYEEGVRVAALCESMLSQAKQTITEINQITEQ